MLLAWTKIVLADELIESDLPDDPYLREDLLAYFPSRMKPDLEAAIEDHPLRREIIVTQVVNDLVNGAGMTFWPRLQGETGATPADLTRANFVAREIFGSLPLRQEIAALDNQVPAERQTRMRIEMRTLVERASRWLVTNRRPPLDSGATVEFFRGRVQARDGRAARHHERARARRLPRPARSGSPTRACPPTSPRASRSWRPPTPCSASSRPPTGSASTRSRWPGSTSRWASGSACRRSWSGSSPCPATTGGRPWRGPRCATTSTASTSS